jgi:hypothetical protein
MPAAPLQAKLLSLNMDTRGKKESLISRLEAVLPALRAAKPAGTTKGEADDEKGLLRTGTTGPAIEAPGASTAAEEVEGSEDELDRAEAALAESLGVMPSSLGVGNLAGFRAPTAATGEKQEAAAEAPPAVVPGTQGLVPASALDAALEKAAAGESRAVEHVALADDTTDALVAGRGPQRRRRQEQAAGQPIRKRGRISAQ